MLMSLLALLQRCPSLSMPARCVADAPRHNQCLLNTCWYSNVKKGMAMNKTLALLDCLAQLKEAQSCADALLSVLVADAVRVNRGRGGVPDRDALKAFRRALETASSHSYQAEMILAEFDSLQTVMPLGQQVLRPITYNS
jgi:hypothetical protein